MKAILSQFSQKKKGSEDGTDGNSNDKDDENEDDEDESDIDLARQTSDEAVLEEIAREAGKVHKLSAVEDDLGCFALTKVWTIWLLISHTSHIHLMCLDYKAGKMYLFFISS